jgi:hypothetical protein
MTSEILASAASPAREIAFIGGGNMARSLVGGLLARGWGASRIHVADPYLPTRESLAADFGVGVHAVNLEAASRAGVWVLAVKPQMMHSVAASLAELAQRQRPLLVSIAAGITSAQLSRWFGGGLAWCGRCRTRLPCSAPERPACTRTPRPRRRSARWSTNCSPPPASPAGSRTRRSWMPSLPSRAAARPTCSCSPRRCRPRPRHRAWRRRSRAS